MSGRRVIGVVVALVFVVGAVWFVRLGWRGGADGPVVTSPRDFFTGRGNDALIVGELLIEDGCVFLSSGDSRSAVVFPAGTKWSESEQAVIVDGTPAREGDSVEGGGGFFSGEALRRNVGDAAFAAVSVCIERAVPADDGEPAGVAVFNRAAFPWDIGGIVVTESR